MNPWDVDGHLIKCKYYAERARIETPTGAFYPMWLSFVQEHLCRAAINKVNPLLGVDLKNEAAILSVTGYGNSSSYKTAEISTIHKRLITIYPELAEGDKLKIFVSMREMRNGEIHSAIPTFNNMESTWLAQFYLACQSVLSIMGKPLDAIFSADESSAATDMIFGLNDKFAGKIKKLIADHKRAFDSLPSSDQLSKSDDAEKFVRIELRFFNPIMKKTSDLNSLTYPDKKTAKCPSCNSLILVHGRIIFRGNPTMEDGEFTSLVTVLPNHLDCPACGLKLDNNASLLVAGLGEQYTVYQEETFSDHVDDYDEDLAYEIYRESRL